MWAKDTSVSAFETIALYGLGLRSVLASELANFLPVYGSGESADSKRQETESSEELRQLVLVFFLFLDRPGKKSELFCV